MEIDKLEAVHNLEKYWNETRKWRDKKKCYQEFTPEVTKYSSEHGEPRLKENLRQSGKAANVTTALRNTELSFPKQAK